MGYFPNGTSWQDYEAKFCDRCIHGQDPDNGCPVAAAHFFFSYEECNSESNAKTMLDMLIPIRKDGLANERCAMFAGTPETAAGDGE